MEIMGNERSPIIRVTLNSKNGCITILSADGKEKTYSMSTINSLYKQTKDIVFADFDPYMRIIEEFEETSDDVEPISEEDLEILLNA